MADVDLNSEFKFCPSCQKNVPIAGFYKSKTYSGGIDSRCKECKKSQNAARNRSPDVARKRSLAASKKWRADKEHREKLKAYQEEYKLRPGIPEHYSILNRESYIRRRDKLREESGWAPKEERKEKACSACNSVLSLDSFYLKKKSNRYYAICKDCSRRKGRQKRMENPEAARERERRYREKNREAFRRQSRKSWEKIKNNPQLRLKSWLRTALGRAVSKGSPHHAAFEVVGYSASELKEHLEKQFLPGMSWNNRHLWHIDHIIPLSRFNITSRDDPELRVAWGLPNLRPIWAKDNLVKHSKVTHLL